MNQRGQESYSGSFVFCVDRWCVSSDAAITDSGLTCSGGNFLLQRMQLKNLPIGRYTGAVCTADGKIVCGSVDFTASGSPEVIASENGIVIYLQKVTSDLVQFVLNSGDQKTWVWAALYAGGYTAETLPEYQPKGYENELLVCRQYDIYTDEYIGLFKFSPPRNLLDNSDFRNPVNQRGVSSGTVSDWAYFIDRWRGLHDCTYELTDGGIVITGGVFCQSLAKGARDNGKTYTFAVCLSTGTIRTLTYTLPEINVSEWVDFNVKGYSDIQLEAGGDSSNYDVIIRYVSVATIRWAALYEGEYTAETLPEYQPKGYGAELLECQRYYQRLSYAQYETIAMGFEGPGYVFIQLSGNNMRLKYPTMTISAPIQIGSRTYMPTGCNINNGTIIIGLNYDTTTTNVGACYAYCPSAGGCVIELNEDL